MSSAVTVRDVMTREFLGVTEGDAVVETVELLLEDGTEHAVVLRGDDPVGVMSERDALAVLVNGTDPASTTVSDAMSRAVVRIAAGASLETAAGAMTREGVGWLLATEDEPVGVVTAHDIVTASTMALDTDASSLTPAVGPTSATDPEAEYDTQGICEACGALARDLVNENGQLVCSNCRDA